MAIQFCSLVPPADPQQRPCHIIGKLANVSKISFSSVSGYLSPRVDEETWIAALESLKRSDSCPLWLNGATVSTLPAQASRHNAPSRPHAITKICAGSKPGAGCDQMAFIIVCEREEVYPLACGVARAFPQYNMKTGSSAAGDYTYLVGFVFVGESTAPLTDEELACLDESCAAIRRTQLIVDTPCSEMHTDGFLSHVWEVSSLLGIQPLIIQGEDLVKNGFGGIYGVGKAAVHQPALAVLSHCPMGATQTIAWVGKGIVYDTGGLSIKGKLNMPGMKRDCGGAAGILGAFYLAVKMGFSQNLHAVLCLAENAVGPKATRPDDVHTFYSGKTVEINNTDAEGRLVLGDGVAYARKSLGADVVVDMATLTGAQGISTGKYHAGILTNSGEMEYSCMQAGRSSGDLVFPLVFCPELHFSEFNSAVADMKNSVANRDNAQSSCAGLFIGCHLGFDYPGTWLHIDMAAPVYSGERATGYGVALLNTLFGSFSANPVLQAIAPQLTLDDTDQPEPATKRQKLA